MSRFVEQIADRNYTSGLPCEIRRQGCGAPSEWSYHWIQFPAPIRQIHVGDRKIARAKNGNRGE